MIQIGKTLVSDDVKSEFFLCDLDRCKGACCVEGDLGAPLDENELEAVERVVEDVKEYLAPEAIDALEKQGPYLIDEEGDYSTTTIGNKECAFAFYEKGILKCGIEQAYLDGKTDFKKPISCHLYPIRLSRLQGDHIALNDDRWHICGPACELGEKMELPIYQFLREPLIRKFGEDWYIELENAINTDQPT